MKVQGLNLKKKLANKLAAEQGHSTPFLIHSASISAKKTKQAETDFVLKKSISSENI